MMNMARVELRKSEETSDSSTDLNDFPIETRRHSGAHLMAYAIQKLYPDTRFGVGPDVRDGWYYDVKMPEGCTLSKESFKTIQKVMLKLKKQKLPFERIELPIDDAIAFMEERGQTYKVELLKDLKTKGTTAVVDSLDNDKTIDISESSGIQKVSFYKLGDFVDLCRGPHVKHSGQVAEFELYNLAGSYWRGNSNNDVMTRIYALSYMSKEEVSNRKRQLIAAKERDHRTLGKKHHLFFIEPDKIGPGLALWEPKGMVIINELKHLAQAMERRYGYQEVRTPEIAYRDLFEQSGHIAHYGDDMFPPMHLKDEKEVFLKPMSCPFHHTIFASHGTPSYQMLPKRFKEWGRVHRYEASGALSGLNRVRSITQDDSHIYLRPDQVIDELLNVIKLSEEYYRLFGFINYRIELALPDWDKKPEKYVNDPEGWEKAIDYMRKAIAKTDIRYTEAKGEAAFYGPKFDFIVEDEVIDKEFTISTLQLDFGATDKFDLKYLGADGQKYPIYVIHRAPLGSLERMTATLIKHYGGRFPVWLAPEQVRVLTISEQDNQIQYAESLILWLEKQSVNNGTSGFRITADLSDNTINKKIRTAQIDQVPYMIIIGPEEVENNNISIRLRSGNQFTLNPEQFLERLRYEAEERQDLSNEDENVLIPKKSVPIFTMFQQAQQKAKEREEEEVEVLVFNKRPS